MVEGVDLHGCVVTADALNTQVEFSNALIKKGADYCLAVKENHKELYLDLQLTFLDVTETTTKNISNSQQTKHGRIENRDYSVWLIDLIQNLLASGSAWMKAHYSNSH